MSISGKWLVQLIQLQVPFISLILNDFYLLFIHHSKMKQANKKL